MRLKWFIFAGLLADAILAVPTYRAIDLRRSNARTSAEVIRLGKALSLYRPDRPESYSVIGPHELGHHHVAVPADLTASVRCSPDEPCYLRA
ncbi:MAG: hypothetical protein HY270_09785 [Deltaproteobacteria bacterium]|nr:hypothetical protein [Deltaproteobacteria bacterium]